MPEEPPPSSSSLAPTEVTSPSIPPRRSHSGVRVARVVAVVAVVVVVLLSLFALGIFTGNSNSGPGAVTLSIAWATANTTAAAHGSWFLAYAAGFDFATTTTENTQFLAYFPGCTLTSFTGSIPGNITWPAFHGNLSAGVATEWMFYYYQPSNENELVVVEAGGDVSVAFELTGTNCAAGSGLAPRTGPIESAVDSPVAVAHALSAGGSDFLRSHPAGVSLSMFLGFGGLWDVSWSTCFDFPDEFGWFGQGFELGVGENESTGAVLPGMTYNGTCGGPPPIGEALGYGTPSLFQGMAQGTLATVGCGASDYCYSVPIVSVSRNVTPGNLSLGVFLNNSGDNGVRGFAILDAIGQVVVSATGTGTGAGGPPWTDGTGTSSTPLTTAMRLTVDMGFLNPGGMGYELVTSGYGSGFASSPYFAVPLP